MKAIQTRFLGPTNYRGARIVATVEGGVSPHRLTIAYPYELGPGQKAHEPAAIALRDKLGWEGELIGGALPNGDYAWVFAPRKDDKR